MKKTANLLALLIAIFCIPSIQAAPIVFSAALTPEVPGATGSGSVTVVFDDGASTLSIAADWSGLSGITTVAHIHCCTLEPGEGNVGVAVSGPTLPGFPEDVTEGTYVNTLDLLLEATYTAAFVTNFGGGTLEGAKNALVAAFFNGSAYFNIHTSAFPPGEIRGFLTPAEAVPEPLSLGLLCLGLLAAAFTRGRRV